MNLNLYLYLSCLGICVSATSDEVCGRNQRLVTSDEPRQIITRNLKNLVEYCEPCPHLYQQHLTHHRKTECQEIESHLFLTVICWVWWAINLASHRRMNREHLAYRVVWWICNLGLALLGVMLATTADGGLTDTEFWFSFGSGMVFGSSVMLLWCKVVVAPLHTPTTNRVAVNIEIP